LSILPSFPTRRSSDLSYARYSSRTSLRRRLLDRGADSRVGAAAADVTVHGLVDLRVGGVRCPLQQRGRGHDLTGLAVTALRHARSEEHTSELQSLTTL